MLGWVFFLAVLGVTMAIPMKRQMINIEQLRFPSGIAAAETLRALHSHGEKGTRAAKALGIAGILAALNQFSGRAPAHQARLGALFDQRPGGQVQRKGLRQALDRTAPCALNWDPIFHRGRCADRPARLRQHDARRHALLGGLRAHHAAPGRHHTDRVSTTWSKWTLWGGVACMVTSGLLSFALQWRSVARALGNLGSMFFARGRARPERNRGHRSADLVVPHRAAHFAGRAGLAGQGDVGYAVLAKCRGRAAHLLPGPGGLPGDGRNRHHAHRRHGQGHAANLRGPQPGPT